MKTHKNLRRVDIQEAMQIAHRLMEKKENDLAYFVLDRWPELSINDQGDVFLKIELINTYFYSETPIKSIFKKFKINTSLILNNKS